MSPFFLVAWQLILLFTYAWYLKNSYTVVLLLYTTSLFSWRAIANQSAPESRVSIQFFFLDTGHIVVLSQKEQGILPRLPQ